jgi:hypothetical protein
MLCYNRIMKRLSFILLCCLALLSPALAQDAAGDLLGRINALRGGRGLSPYALNGALSAAAQDQAQWMVANSLAISHVRPDGSSPRSRALAFGYPSAFVGENIYAGTNASVDSAWNFWVNSPIHYAGLTHASFNEVGIGAASGASGRAYVLVFGNASGYTAAVSAPSNNGGGASGGNANTGSTVNTSNQSAPPPSFIMGTDENGNLLHQVQGGDTVGGIALLYGYGWEDVAFLLQLNGLNDPSELKEGELFLLPPRGGTHTPTPIPPTATPDERLPTVDPNAPPTLTPTTSPTPDLTVSAASVVALQATIAPTLAEVILSHAPLPTLSATPSPTLIPITQGGTVTQNNTQGLWIAFAVGLQVVVLSLAGFDFWRRRQKR